MKLSVLQGDLLPKLQAVSRSVGVKVTLPVLGNILLSASDNQLKIAATNLEIGVIKFLAVEVIDPGDLTVPAKTLTEVIQGLPSIKIDLESKGDILTITAGKFKANINGISASEFPAIPMAEGDGVIFPKELLLSTGQILFAAAIDEGRPILTGILTEVKNGLLNLVATDGFRLAHREVKLPDSAFEFKSLIPKRTFEELLRLISEEDLESVSIATSKGQNQVVFTTPNTIVSSRLIEGQFPNWEKIIPTNITTRAMIEKEDLLKAVKLAAIFAKTEAYVVTLKTSDGKITLTSEAKELGSQENEVDSQVEGEGIKISFNAKYLLDALQATSSTQLMLEFSGPLTPTIIKPMGIEGLEYIVMPVRPS